MTERKTDNFPGVGWKRWRPKEEDLSSQEILNDRETKKDLIQHFMSMSEELDKLMKANESLAMIFNRRSTQTEKFDRHKFLAEKKKLIGMVDGFNQEVKSGLEQAGLKFLSTEEEEDWDLLRQMKWNIRQLVNEQAELQQNLSQVNQKNWQDFQENIQGRILEIKPIMAGFTERIQELIKRFDVESPEEKEQGFEKLVDKFRQNARVELSFYSGAGDNRVTVGNSVEKTGGGDKLIKERLNIIPVQGGADFGGDHVEGNFAGEAIVWGDLPGKTGDYVRTTEEPREKEKPANFMLIKVRRPWVHARGKHYPTVDIIGSDELIGEGLNFLKSNPDQIYAFLEGIYPGDKDQGFLETRKGNRGFIHHGEKIFQGIKVAPELVILDAKKMDKAWQEYRDSGKKSGKADFLVDSGFNRGFKPWVYDECGILYRRGNDGQWREMPPKEKVSLVVKPEKREFSEEKIFREFVRYIKKNTGAVINFGQVGTEFDELGDEDQGIAVHNLKEKNFSRIALLTNELLGGLPDKSLFGTPDLKNCRQEAIIFGPMLGRLSEWVKETEGPTAQEKLIWQLEHGDKPMVSPEAWFMKVKIRQKVKRMKNYPEVIFVGKEKDILEMTRRIKYDPDRLYDFLGEYFSDEKYLKVNQRLFANQEVGPEMRFLEIEFIDKEEKKSQKLLSRSGKIKDSVYKNYGSIRRRKNGKWNIVKK